MPIYEFHCTECGSEKTVEQSITEYSSGPYSDRASEERRCKVCGTQTARRFAFAAKHAMPDHYNRSAGEYVTGERQLRDAFKRQSEAATIRTGVEHNFVPIDLGDKASLGVTNEGLKESYDQRRKLGMAIPSGMKPENTGD